MKTILQTVMQLGVFLWVATPAFSWDHFYLDVPPGQGEAAWIDAFSDHLDAQKEVSIEGGRIDVLSEDWAIEVDRAHKWHEGLGQALHYADATGKQGVLALIAYTKSPEKLSSAVLKRLQLVESNCNKHDIKLVVLFPGAPRTAGPTEIALLSASRSSSDYWLNNKSKVRHNSGCRYFGKTGSGHASDAQSGRACGLCGG